MRAGGGEAGWSESKTRRRRWRRWQEKCNPCQRVSGPVCTKAAVLQPRFGFHESKRLQGSVKSKTRWEQGVPENAVENGDGESAAFVSTFSEINLIGRRFSASG